MWKPYKDVNPRIYFGFGPMKTIYEALQDRLRRPPTSAEIRAEVARILGEAFQKAAIAQQRRKQIHQQME